MDNKKTNNLPPAGSSSNVLSLRRESEDPFLVCKVAFRQSDAEEIELNGRQIAIKEVVYLIIYKVLVVVGKNSKGQDRREWLNQLSIFTSTSEQMVTRHKDILLVRACAEKLASTVKTKLYMSLEEREIKNVRSITQIAFGRNWDEVDWPYYTLLNKYRDQIRSQTSTIPRFLKVQNNGAFTKINYSMPYAYSLNHSAVKFGCLFFVLILITGIWSGPKGRGNVPFWLLMLDVAAFLLVVLADFYYKNIKYLNVEVKITETSFEFKEFFAKKTEGFTVRSKLVEEIQIVEKTDIFIKFKEMQLFSDCKVYKIGIPPHYASPLKDSIDRAFLRLNED